MPLPANLVSRFKGKTMAITGYEVDTIRLLPDGSTEHVPIYDEYNHHHAAWIVGGTLPGAPTVSACCLWPAS